MQVCVDTCRRTDCGEKKAKVKREDSWRSSRWLTDQFGSRRHVDPPVSNAHANRADAAGKPSLTWWRLLATSTDRRASRLLLAPRTGRTHQLRAHMAAIGHPILGDHKYGDEKSRELSGVLKLQLHARRIELDHPGGGTLVVEAPLSPEIKAGFAHFGFSEDESDVDPFEGVKRQR